MTKEFITYFDRNYLTRGLALYRSLERHAGDFRLTIVCFDDETRAILSALALPRARLRSEAELLAFDPALDVARRDGRRRVEFYFTTTPILALWLLSDAATEVATYLDADLYFFSSPEALFDELRDRSILVHEHQFHPADAWKLAHGRFNVGAVMFRRDALASAALARWRGQCLACCTRLLSENKNGDQGYLDEWPERYGDRLAISAHPGIGVGPWNLRGRRFVPGDPPRIEGRPVVFFHAHGFRVHTPRVFEHVHSFVTTSDHRRVLYTPYALALGDAMKEVLTVASRFRAGFTGARTRRVISAIVHRRVLVNAGRIWHL